MYPGWGRYGSYPTPSATPAPPPAPPAVGPPPPPSTFQSFRDQHLAQLEQLQRMHQRQLETVLPAGGPPPAPAAFPPPAFGKRPFYGPRQPYTYPPPPYGQSLPPPGYPAYPPPESSGQHPPPDPSHPPPPPGPAPELAQPPPPPGPAQPPEPAQPPPPPPPSGPIHPPPSEELPQATETDNSQDKGPPDTSLEVSDHKLSLHNFQIPAQAPPSRNKTPPPQSCPMSKTLLHTERDVVSEQHQFWYKQHLLSLQKKAKVRQKEATAPDGPPEAPQDSGSHVSASFPPPPPVHELKNEVQPPLPLEDVKPNVDPPEDPEQAQRLKTLQEAAAHWQQHEQHRLGFQYQGIMQKNATLQQLLQRYQQVTQQPPHLAAMTVDVQLQHFEMQQKQFLSLHQEWENQYKKWQELLQTYPHKDQLQDYQVQWKSWHEQMKTTKSYFKERVTSLKSMKQQYGGSHYIGGVPMIPAYPAYPPVMPPPVPPPLPAGMSVPPPFAAPASSLFSAAPPLPPPMTPTPFAEVPPPLPPVTSNSYGEVPPPPVTYAEVPPPPPVTATPYDNIPPPLPPDSYSELPQPPPPPVASAVSSAVPPDTSYSYSADTAAALVSSVPADTNDSGLPPFALPNTSFTGAGQTAVDTFNLVPGSSATSNLPDKLSAKPSAGTSTNSVPDFSSYCPPKEENNLKSIGSAMKEISEGRVPSKDEQKPRDVNPQAGQSQVPSLGASNSVPPPPHQLIRGMQFGSGPPRFAPHGRGFPPPRFQMPDSQGAQSSPGPRPVFDGQTTSMASLGPEKPSSSQGLKSGNRLGFAPQSNWMNASQATDCEVSDNTKTVDKIPGLSETGIQSSVPLTASSPSPSKESVARSRGAVKAGSSSGKWDQTEPPSKGNLEKSKESVETCDRKVGASQHGHIMGKNQGGSGVKWDWQKETAGVFTEGKWSDHETPIREGCVKQGDSVPVKWGGPDVPGLGVGVSPRGAPKSNCGTYEGQQDDAKSALPNRWEVAPGDRWPKPLVSPHEKWVDPGEPPKGDPCDPKSGDKWGNSQDPTPERWSGPKGPTCDRWSGPGGPPLERLSDKHFEVFGGPDGPQGRLGGPPGNRCGAPPWERFGGSAGPPGDRPGGPVGPWGRTGGPQQDRFDGPPRERFDGPPRERFGSPDGPPQEGFEGPPRERFGDPEGPMGGRFGGPDCPPGDRFDGPDGRSHGRFGGSLHATFGGPDGSLDENFDGLDGPPHERFGISDDPPGDRFGSMEGGRFGPPGERFNGPPHRFGGPTGPPHGRFGGPWTPRPRFGEPHGPPRARFGEPHGPPRARFGEPHGPPRARFGEPHGPPRARFGEPRGPLYDRFGEPHYPPHDRFGGSHGPNKFGEPHCPPHDSFGGPHGPDNFGEPLGPLDDGFEGPEGPPDDRFASPNFVPRDRRLPSEPMPSGDRWGGPPNVDGKWRQSNWVGHGDPLQSKLRAASGDLESRFNKDRQIGQTDPEMEPPGVKARYPDPQQTAEMARVSYQSQFRRGIQKPLVPEFKTDKPPQGAVGPKTSAIQSVGSQAMESTGAGGMKTTEPSKGEKPTSTLPSSGGMHPPAESANVAGAQVAEPANLEAPGAAGHATTSLPPASAKAEGQQPPASDKQMSSVDTKGLVTNKASLDNVTHKADERQMPEPTKEDSSKVPASSKDIQPTAVANKPGTKGLIQDASKVTPMASKDQDGQNQVLSTADTKSQGLAKDSSAGDKGPQSGNVPMAGCSTDRPGTQPVSKAHSLFKRDAVKGNQVHVPQRPSESLTSNPELANAGARVPGPSRFGPQANQGICGPKPHGKPMESHDPAQWSSHGHRGEEPVWFDHRGRGRARGMVRERIPPRPGNRDVLEILRDKNFGPRSHFGNERPFEECLDDAPPFVREALPRDARFIEDERYPLDHLADVRRRDVPLDRERLDNWEQERYWRETDHLREPLDQISRDDRLPYHSTLPRDVDIRRDPWLERVPDQGLERTLGGALERSERPFERDYPRMHDELEFLGRDRGYPPLHRSVSPHRPLSPLRPRSPLPPVDRYLDDRWREDREVLLERDFHDRGELRIREYPERSDFWQEGRNFPCEQVEWERRDNRWYPPEDRPVDQRLGTHPSLAPVSSNHPGQPDTGIASEPEPTAAPAGMLALSQRQHEIILKAAQELKMLREQKEQLDNLKHFYNDPKPREEASLRPGLPGAHNRPSDIYQLPPGAPLKDVGPEGDCSGSKAVPAGASSQAPASDRWDEDSFSGLWEDERRAKVAGVLSDSGQPGSMAHGPKLPGLQQTVDYAHGRDRPVGKVEQVPYGERVVLLPDPVLERIGHPFHKDYLDDNYDMDLRDRASYLERQSNKSMDRREYERDREREMHRDRGPSDHERERFDRDRHSRERSASYRDGKESLARRGSDKLPYNRKSERDPYELASPAFGGERRNYPEEKPLLHPPMPAPRQEKKPESKNVDDLLKKPGRESRPERIVVIMRGLPGSGKTHVAKLIRDKEVECGGAAPRVLSLDDYFITEVEKVEKDPDTGKKVKKKVMEYEYEAEMEDTYRSSMFKTFKKTLDDGFFPFIILDSINDRVRHFEQFWSAAKTKGFEVYVAEISADTQICAKRNLHGRKLKEINKMADNWETAPRHMIRLDIRSLLQDAAIEEVEMEDSEPSVEPAAETNPEPSEEEESDRGYLPKSKWEMDTSEAKLDKLDGLKVNKKKRGWEAVGGRMEDYLQLPDDYDSRESEPGRKRVRWADLEEKKDADRKRAIGFIVGQTDWEKITDKSGQLAERALNRTKYI